MRHGDVLDQSNLCAVRGQEHCDLRCPGHDSQFSVEQNPQTGEKVLVYRGTSSQKQTREG